MASLFAFSQARQYIPNTVNSINMVWADIILKNRCWYEMATK